MAFIDEINIHVSAGKGGDGVVRWRHEKGKALAGAAGGNGGKGGDVSIEAVSDLGILSSYRQVKEFRAKDGAPGENWSRHGKDGESIVVKVPVGSIVTNKATQDVYNLTKAGDIVCVARGGRGGLGNEHFKASTNTSPQESTPGKEGEECDLYIELELVADIGLVGLPNAGKSSLLNALTKARAKVGSYQFTTLEPNLGDMYGVIVADIPGLIEGASEGKGLGHKFLRHIKRTKMLLHCISAELENPIEVYNIVRNELITYDKEMANKKEIILITKTDMVGGGVLEEIKKALKNLPAQAGKNILTVSVLDDASVKALSDELVKQVRS